MKEFIISICLIFTISCLNEKSDTKSTKMSNDATIQSKLEPKYIVNDSSKLTPYPYQGEFEKSQKEFLELQKALKNDGIMIDDFPDSAPEFYILTLSGDSLKFHDFLRSEKCDFPPKLIFVLIIDIDWTGEIWRIELLKKSGQEPKDFNFLKFVKRIKAKPATKKGVAIPSRYSVRLEKREDSH
jgi:hypothetical protein